MAKTASTCGEVAVSGLRVVCGGASSVYEMGPAAHDWCDGAQRQLAAPPDVDETVGGDTAHVSEDDGCKEGGIQPAQVDEAHPKADGVARHCGHRARTSGGGLREASAEAHSLMLA